MITRQNVRTVLLGDPQYWSKKIKVDPAIIEAALSGNRDSMHYVLSAIDRHFRPMRIAACL